VVRTFAERRDRRGGQVPADPRRHARLVLELGDGVQACLEMMSGALWARDELTARGWRVEVAAARKVKTVAPAAAKTDELDARLLAELSRRGLVPALWLPSLDERALRELRRRMHLVRLRTSAKGRIVGLQTQRGVRVSLACQSLIDLRLTAACEDARPSRGE
jgi:Transposase